MTVLKNPRHYSSEGLMTTMHLMGSSALMLTERAELLQRLRAEPSLIPSFVDEMLRYEAPATSTFRLTTKDVELGGVALPQHTPLILLLGSACRDDRCVPDGERFVLGRKEQTNLPFGHGIHFCLGVNLARMETRVAMEILVAHVGGLSRKPGPLRWIQSIQVRGPAELQLDVLPA